MPENVERKKNNTRGQNEDSQDRSRQAGKGRDAGCLRLAEVVLYAEGVARESGPVLLCVCRQIVLLVAKGLDAVLLCVFPHRRFDERVGSTTLA